MQANGGLGLALCVGTLGQLLEPALVGLGQLVLGEGNLSLEPLGAGDAVVAAEAGEVLGGLGGLEAVEVGGRQEVVGDLVNVSGKGKEDVSKEEVVEMAKRWLVLTSSSDASW